MQVETQEHNVDHKNTLEHMDFVTEQSKCIPLKRLNNMQKQIERSKSISELNTAIKNILYAMEIEAGIFEYCLVYVVEHNLSDNMFHSVYQYKVDDIIKNIEMNPEILEHISRKEMKPRMLAYLKPSQLFPEKWSKLLAKKQLKEETENNLPTTDLYKCFKCDQRRSTIRFLQTRSSDEPMTIFVTCCNCHNTFTI